ncbi:Xaa-Pro aminopeptidase [Strigomonas culicis]|nr:Xaa-Pro aminopeptidase [Strigomonas culicis]|eukprot:EPY27090.1 Xaa-Pro aminopeptidase [Strigomonas culicis]
METHFCDLVIVSALDEVAWLTNLRGGRDVPYNPVFYSYALVDFRDPHKRIRVYVDAEKVNQSPSIVAAYGRAPTPDDGGASSPQQDLLFLPYEQLAADIAALTAGAAAPARKALVDERQTSEGVRRLLQQHGIPYKRVRCGPLQTLKAKKNSAELEGFRACHVRDGAHLTRYLAWLHEHAERQAGTFQLHDGAEGSEGETVPLTEYTAAERLERFRAEDPDFIQLSFETISGVGANGAIVHYSASREGAAPLLDAAGGADHGMYLVDSGAQYADGTTDVTRTVFLPSPRWPRPTAHHRRLYTHVLKGHLLLHRTRFPDNHRVTGHRLDTLARWPLWQHCQQDYAHGTGHGVGSLLNVHEGPHGIGSAPAPTGAALQEGYITSNEPGYYETGAFGIRIENLEEIVADPPLADAPPSTGGAAPMKF